MHQRILKLLFPTFCIGCGNYGEMLCPKCKVFLYRTIPECLYCRHLSNQYITHKGCKNRKQQISVAYTCFTYNWLGRKIMKKLKFEGISAIQQLLTDNIYPQLSLISKCISPTGPPSLLIPIPIHQKRLLERGYNQITFFAKYLDKQGYGKSVENLLLKARNSVSQSRKELRERGYHGVNPFVVNIEVASNLNPIHAPNFTIVDDVITTGNTLMMASQALKKSFPDAKINAIALFRPVFKGSKTI